MAVSSVRRILHELTGDFIGRYDVVAATNGVSPGKVDVISLASGNNTITPPSGGTTPKAITIVPPAGNAVLIILKGVNGDTGIELHKTDPTSIGLNSPTNTLVLNAASALDGVRLIWS